MDRSQNPFQSFHYYHDNRTPQDIESTNRAIRAISQANVARIQSSQQSSTSPGKANKTDWLYVCMPGLPSIGKEFSALELPGENFQYEVSLFKKGLNQEEMSNSWKEQSAKLQKQINSRSKTKPIVFVYHSFGSYFLFQYMKFYEPSRVVGLIDLGEPPIRFFPFLKRVHQIIYLPNQQNILYNLQQQMNQFNEEARKTNPKYSVSSSDFLGLARTVSHPGFGFQDMFEAHRKLPAIVKCIIFGVKDEFFLEDNLNEKSLFFSQQPLSPYYQASLRRAFKKLEGREVQSVQQQFIFNIPGAKHSLHMQKSFREVIRRIVSSYLTFLEEVYSQGQASL